MSDKQFMNRCLELAEVALENGDPPVGAILVVDSTIIGEGVESGKSSGDVTNHAEIDAVRNAIRNGHSELLTSAIMYTTHEPCIMCSYVIRHHRIPGIIYGISVDHIGGHTSDFNVLGNESIPFWGNPPTMTGNVAIEECRLLNNRFKTLKKP